MIYTINILYTTVYQFWRFVYHLEQSVIDHYIRRSDSTYIIYHGPVLLLSQKNRLHSRVFGQNRPRHLCYHCVEPVGARIYELSGAEFCKSLPSGAHWALCDQKPFFSTFFNVFFVGFNQKYIVPRPQNIFYFFCMSIFRHFMYIST